MKSIRITLTFLALLATAGCGKRLEEENQQLRDTNAKLSAELAGVKAGLTARLESVQAELTANNAKAAAEVARLNKDSVTERERTGKAFKTLEERLDAKTTMVNFKRASKILNELMNDGIKVVSGAYRNSLRRDLRETAATAAKADCDSVSTEGSAYRQWAKRAADANLQVQDLTTAVDPDKSTRDVSERIRQFSRNLPAKIGKLCDLNFKACEEGKSLAFTQSQSNRSADSLDEVGLYLERSTKAYERTISYEPSRKAVIEETTTEWNALDRRIDSLE